MSTTRDQRPRFSLGRLVVSAGAAEQIGKSDVLTGLARHICGDWGDLSAADIAANDDALRDSERLLSSYRTATGRAFWIITEHDRSLTTVLLPSEY